MLTYNASTFLLRDVPYSGSYDEAQGWTDGHGYMYRRCHLAIEGRTKEYCDGLCIASNTDITDYRLLREPKMP